MAGAAKCAPVFIRERAEGCLGGGGRKWDIALPPVGLGTIPVLCPVGTGAMTCSGGGARVKGREGPYSTVDSPAREFGAGEYAGGGSAFGSSGAGGRIVSGSSVVGGGREPADMPVWDGASTPPEGRMGLYTRYAAVVIEV